MNTVFFDFQAVTPIEFVRFCNQDGQIAHLSVKRDDLIDPQISGNKWRKLKFNFHQLQDTNKIGIASFGGAFSNHIAALAAAGHRANINTIGFIRTHEIDVDNPTLKLALERGMTLVPLSREDYKKRSEPDFLQSLEQQYPEYFFVPEGGSNQSAMLGLKELAEEISQQSNAETIACAIGSGGTISGLLDAMPDKKFIGVAAVNDEALLQRLKDKYQQRLTIITSALFGGYGKTTDELNQFCLSFFQQTNIPIEPIYTGKLFYALCHDKRLIKKNDLLVIHTGGLQGLKGLSYRRQCSPVLWQPIISQLDV